MPKNDTLFFLKYLYIFILILYFIKKLKNNHYFKVNNGILLNMDVLLPSDRHRNMSNVHSKNTKPEKQIRSALFRAGFRYRICDKRYPGTPDLIFPKYYAVIFINGCFWHAHENCKYFSFPKTNVDFWKKKFETNKFRDAETLKYYKEQCWRVCLVWECSIRGKCSKQKIESVKDQIIQWLEEPGESFLEIKENYYQTTQHIPLNT